MANKKQAFLKKKNNKLRACKSLGSNFVFFTLKSLEKHKEKLQKEIEEKKQIGEAQQVVAKQSSKKSKVRTSLMLLGNLVLVAVILFFQIRNEGVVSADELFFNKLNYGYFFVVILLFIIFFVLKSLRFNLLIKNSPHKRSRPFLSYKLAALGKYYDAITPMASGESPFQIFYLSKKGFDTSAAISVPIAKYIITQFSWMTVSAFAVIYSLVNNTLASSKVILIIALTGFVLNILLVSAVLFSAFSAKFGKIVMARILRFLEKIKIVKNYEKQYSKVIKTVEEYQDALKGYIKKPYVLIINYFLSVLIYMVNYTILFFIYSMLVRFDPSLYGEIIVKALIVDIASSLIPLPGGSGVSEISFGMVFPSIFVDGTLFWGVLMWRIINYYGMLVQGFFILVYDYFVGDKKYEWQKKKWALEAESLEFRNKRLEEYNRKKRRRRIKR